MDEVVPRSILLLVLLLLGGLFAGTETALSFCNQVRIRVMADDGDARAKCVSTALEAYDRAVVTLLICINIIYVTSASVATLIAVEWMGDTGSLVATIVTTLLVFFCCETIPKNIARVNADQYILRCGRMLRALMWLLYPASFVLSALGGWAKHHLLKGKMAEPTVTEDEFASIVSDAEEDGTIDHEESDIIRSAIDFGDIQAKDVMTPREAICAVEMNMTNEALKQAFLENKFSRMPVYEGDLNHVVGVVRSVNCLWKLMKAEDFDLRENITRPYFVAPDMLINQVFEGMSVHRSHMAIVRGKDGTVLGLLTMEDILEELVGEIYDEDDTQRKEGKGE